MRRAWKIIAMILLFAWSQVQGQEKIYLSIDFSAPGITVSPLLYGIFFEDINFAADGGLYAELIRNRSFEESTIFWRLIEGSGSQGTRTIETENLLNSAQKKCLRLTADTIGPGGYVGVQNPGFYGINVVDRMEYKLSFYAKCSETFNGALIASLNSTDGNFQYAIQRMGGISTEWQKYTCSLVASGTNPNAEFSLRINGAGTVWFDVVSLFPPTYNNRENGLRLDLGEKLQEIHPAFMRFPGGCFVEGGTMAQAFRWKQTIGPIEERPGHDNFWGYRTSDGMGYHEFLQLCEDLGAEPLYVCNVGMSRNESVDLSDLNPWIQDALNAIEYANGDTTTTWGHKRKLNGHPTPFGMKYIELGNEEWYEPYTSHYNMFYDSIKTYYPKMTTISNTSWSSLNHIEIYDDHYYSSPDWFAQNSNKYDNTSRTGPKVYVGEYAVTSGGAGNGNLRCAIGESAFMTGFERNSDVVIMSSYAPLLGNLNNRQWNPDAIYYNSSDCYGTPSYYAQKMFSNNTGNKYIPIKDSLNTDAVLSYNGAIGVGTWVTRCQYDSVKVWSDDSVIIDENFDIDASGWDVYGGTWIVNDGVYEQTSLNTDCRSTIGNIDLPSYIYHLKAKKISGNEGFLIIFGYTDDNNFYWWNIGGWSNTLSAIEHAIDGSKGTITSVSYSVETNRWYDLKIEVKDDSAKCYLDGVLMHAISVGLKQLYNSCTIDTMNQDIYLKIVNFSDSDQPAEICMKNLPEDIILKGSIQTMTYSNPYSENSITNPERIAPSIQDFSSTNTGFQYTFPQNSVNIFHLYPQSDLFQLPDETFSIPENSDNGTIVGILSANGGSEYTYAILKASLEGVFEINDSTGEVLVKTSSLLNYELTPSVLLTVTARDRMNDTIPAARGTCIINLTDVNEKPTLVNNNYYAFANDSSGTTIGTIFLTDEDIGQNYSYSITSQSVENVLFIDPLTGDITINDDDALRAAVSETIVFSVHAFDDGSPSLSDDNEYTLKVMNTPSLVLEINSIINHDLVIFPNPAGGDIIVMIPEVKEDQYLKMVDFRGRIIYYQKVQTNPTKIETSDFTDGIYCIQVLSGSTITGIQNVVIQK